MDVIKEQEEEELERHVHSGEAGKFDVP